MSNYYYTMVFITLGTMVTSIIHLFENETLSRRVKNKLTLIASLIIVGSLCEFLCICLNDFPICSRYIHGLIKAIEFTVAPIIPVCYVRLVEKRNMSKIVQISTNTFLIFNAICEFTSIFTPFIFFINYNNVYEHYTYYPIYTIIYLSGIVIFIFALLRYTQKYQSRNIATLISMVSFLLIGFSIRLMDNTIYSDWLVVAISYLLFIIYYSDLSLKVDALTDLFNRKSYEHRLKKLDYATAIILLDVNEFKQVNDTYGHQCGDKLLKIIAKTILKAYGKYGYCYRIGGDEFCVILKQGVIEEFSEKNTKSKLSEFLDELNGTFDKLLEEQYEDFPMLHCGVSKGYAVFHGLYDLNSQGNGNKHYSLTSVKETIKLADERMYENKRNSKKEA